MTGLGSHPSQRAAIGLLAACICLLAAAALAACGGGAADGGAVAGTRLAIYSSMPLEGPDRPAAVDVVRGQRLALRDHGRRVGRYRVDLVQLDAATPEADRWDPQQISENARAAAKDPDAIAYIGEFHAGSSAISIPRLNEVGVLEVSPMDTAMELTSRNPVVPGSPEKYFPKEEEFGRTFARLVPSDRWQAVAQLDYMAREGVSRLVVVADEDPMAIGYATVMRARARERGIALVALEEIDARDRDARDLVERILEARPDAVFFAGAAHDGVVALWRRLAAAEPRVKLFAPDALVDAPFAAAIGAAGAATYVTRPVVGLHDYPKEARRFARRFAEVYGRSPRAEALYGYEAMSAVLAAIRRAADAAGDRPLDRRDVVTAFRESRRRGTVLGTYAISDSGETTLRRFGAYRLIDGELRYRYPLDP